ncbi:hypothetical protein CLOLEP_02819 [[Clostridium] leptum DSM 753]|uniref:Uncharacterized protein n=1 Tax=[Clostridium] leptum DSM 753 TaxID=428125 RepID=A7VW55_9FIRM|nr:hypothetical protein CLOLEP_02819 [[Clostridium] leptum DSM 753]
MDSLHFNKAFSPAGVFFCALFGGRFAPALKRNHFSLFIRPQSLARRHWTKGNGRRQCAPSVSRYFSL